MKKSIFLLSLAALCGCATTQNLGNGLTRLNEEPKNCDFLYNLDSSVTTYKLSGAYDYIEKSILENKDLIGDSYLIVNEDVIDNVGAIFGPEHTYKFKVKVYDCIK